MAKTVTLGVLGCGDVAFRTYFPGLAPLVDAGRVRVAACADPRVEQAERAAALFPGARAVATLDDLLAEPGLDALVNLTPAPLDRATTTGALEAGLHVFSEKPIAATGEAAPAVTALAAQRGPVPPGSPAG